MLVTLDFETYWDADYTLKKLATSEYIRHPLFKAISCSIKIDNKKPFCYFGDDIKPALAKINWSKALLLCHHTQFDALILTHHYGHTPKYYLCTLSMARALHPKNERADLATVAQHYDVVNKLEMPDFKGRQVDELDAAERKAIAKYNNGDVESCYQAYKKMKEGFPQSELDLIDLTIRMFAEPVLRVDMVGARKELKREQDAKNAAVEASGVDLDTLSSNPKFVAALEAHGVVVPTKPSPSIPGKQIPAVAKSDESLQALLTHPDPAVVRLIEGRLAAKSTIAESRAARMILYGAKNMRLPIYYNYAMAHTFRWSGGDKFNPQNFKQSKKTGGNLRKCILAPKGYHAIAVDASQIEARVVAWLAGEEWILDAFRNKRDLYSEFASDAYGRTITKADEEERFVGKTCILGLGFNMGGPKLQLSLLTQSIAQGLDPVRLPLDVCYSLVSKYRTKCAEIVKLWKFANDRMIGAMLTGNELKYKCLRVEEGKIHLPNGLALLYPGLNANLVKSGSGFFKDKLGETIQDASYLSGRFRSKLYGGLLVENIVQALARIIVADVMLEIARRYRIVMITHDEIVFIAKEKEADQALEWAIGLMSQSPIWAPDLPLTAEGKHAEFYAK